MKQRVLLKGADALDLIHRISTLDIKRLVLNEKREGILLNPQGKIVSFFILTRTEKDQALVEFDDSFLEELDKFTFAEKYEIEKLPNSPEIKGNELERISNLVPAYGKEFLSNGETNPLEVNLKHAISDQKGCYPGQEIIEKIISLGSPPRRLCLLECTSLQNPLLPLKLFSEDGSEVGILTSFESPLGLAILKRTHLKTGIMLHSEAHRLKVEKVSS